MASQSISKLFSALLPVSSFGGITGAVKSGVLHMDQQGESSSHLGEARGKPQPVSKTAIWVLSRWKT